MALVGNLGSLITFEVSSNKVLTFSGMNRKVSGRWAEHQVIGGKAEAEFLGPDLQEVSMSIYLSSMHGIRPRKTLERIQEAAESGDYFSFVIGGKKVGSKKWRITSVSETWDNIIKNGDLVSAKVSLTLREYV